MDLWHLWEGAPSLRACFAIVRISSGPPFLKSCVTLLHSNVFAGQSPTLPTIKPIKIYTIRILYTHYAWVLRLWTKDIDPTHQGQFLTPDSQIRTNCSWHMMTLTFNFRQRSEVFGNWSEIFGSRRHVSGNLGHDKVKISRIWLWKSWQV